jgi:hypothetical protein
LTFKLNQNQLYLIFCSFTVACAKYANAKQRLARERTPEMERRLAGSGKAG